MFTNAVKVTVWPTVLGLADEDTAVVVRGRSLTVLGSNNVRVCLPAGRDGDEKVKVFAPGDRIDLAALRDWRVEDVRPLLAFGRGGGPRIDGHGQPLARERERERPADDAAAVDPDP